MNLKHRRGTTRETHEPLGGQGPRTTTYRVRTTSSRRLTTRSEDRLGEAWGDADTMREEAERERKRAIHPRSHIPWTEQQDEEQGQIHLSETKPGCAGGSGPITKTNLLRDSAMA